MERQFAVRFPCAASALDLDEEYFTVVQEQQERKLRLHDYHEVFAIPGLYEFVYCEMLKGVSHKKVSALLLEEVARKGCAPSELRVLDLGAGNGLAGEILVEGGVASVVGLDIIAEAREAALRDRPDIYDEYYVEDVLNLAAATREKLEKRGINCLVCMSALGFGDVSSAALRAAFNLISDGGWVAFNIEERFNEPGSGSGFHQLIHRAEKSGALDVRVRERYCHRISMAGCPIYYVAVVGLKRSDISAEDKIVAA